MDNTTIIRSRSVTQIPESSLARFLFADTRLAWFWLCVRVYVGYQWLTSGLGKLTGHSIGFGSFGVAPRGGPWAFSGHDGVALSAFLTRAVAQSHATNPIVQSWYASFLQSFVLPHVTLFAYLITFGETLVGVALILGFLTGLSAFFGLFLNANYLLAGSMGGMNLLLLTLALLLILARRVDGYYGLDRYMLPFLRRSGLKAWRPRPHLRSHHVRWRRPDRAAGRWKTIAKQRR